MRGFTLLELLVVLALIAITTFFALPALHSILLKQKATTQVNKLVRSLNYARNLAIVRESTVEVCPVSKKAKECGDHWQQGIRVFLLNSTSKQLVLQTPVFDNAVITWNRKNQTLKFLPTGRLKSQNGSFEYSVNQGSNYTKKIILSSTGRVRIIAIEGKV